MNLSNRIITTDSVYPNGCLSIYTSTNYFGTTAKNGYKNGVVVFSNTSNNYGSLINTTGFTFSSWIKPTIPANGEGANDPAGIMHFVPSTTGTSTEAPASYISIFYQRRYLTNPQRIIIQLSSNSYECILTNNVNELTDGNWHFIALVFQGTSINVYVDNQSYTISIGSTSLIPNAALNLTMGCNYTNLAGEYWGGSYKYLFGWNTALTASDIRLMTAVNYARPQTSLNGYYLFNTADLSTNNINIRNGFTGLYTAYLSTMSNVYIDTNYALFGTASLYVFNGTGNYCIIPTNTTTTINSGFSVCGWFNILSGTSNGYMYITNEPTPQSSRSNIYYFQNINSPQSLRFAKYADGKNEYLYDVNTGITNSNWYHLSLVFSVNSIIVYINGKQIAVLSPQTYTNLTPSIVLLGNNYSGLPAATFACHNFRIYSSAISAMDVYSIYNTIQQ
jgi:hypothetical protein